MLLQAELGGRDQAVSNGEQSGLPMTMPAPIDGNCFQAGIDGGEMVTGGDPGLAQDGCGKQPAKPGRVLKDGKFVPGIEDDDGLQHSRQVLGVPLHALPFVKPRILVPVEITHQRIFFRRVGATGPCYVLDRGLRSREHRINGGIVGARKVFDGVDILPFRIGRDRTSGGAKHLCGVCADRR